MLKKIVYEGQQTPKCYGLAYFKHDAGYAVCYPIPINILIRVWLKLKYGLFKIGIEDIYEQAFNQGWQQGWETAKRAYNIKEQ